MSDGLSYYYESLEEEKHEKALAKFKQVDAGTLYNSLKEINETAYQLIRSDLALTKGQHRMLDKIYEESKKALGIHVP